MSRGYGRVQRAILDYLHDNRGWARHRKLASVCQTSASNIVRALRVLERDGRVQYRTLYRGPGGWDVREVSELVDELGANSLTVDGIHPKNGDEASYQ